MNIEETLLEILQSLNRILAAGNAITALSLLLYTLTFTLRERVARVFALLMFCVAFVYSLDVLASTTQADSEVEFWLRLQWIGIAFIPAAYVNLSDALLAATGRPSRGRRRIAVLLSYLIGILVIALVYGTDLIAGELRYSGDAGYLEAGLLFPIFTLFLLVILGFSGLNYWRAYKRSLTRSSRRRLRYLMVGSLGPILATYPFLMVGGDIGGNFPLFFWISLDLITTIVGVLLVLMAYAIAYFGVSYPDRVVKSRLSQWILRGPIVASSVLAVTVIANRIAIYIGLDGDRIVPLVMVGTLLILQYLITLVRQPIERWFFYGEDRNDIARLQLLEDRLLTTGDLQQFLESVLNSACDMTDSASAFVAVMVDGKLELEVAVGPEDPLRGNGELPAFIMADQKREVDGLGTVFFWDHFWLIPLRSPEAEGEIIGLLGLSATSQTPEFDEEQVEALSILTDRASVALTDRLLQRETFAVVDRLVPQVEEIHRMRAAARYIGSEALISPIDPLATDADMFHLVRDALTHYWGGPRLTKSPLLRLRVVNQTINEHGGNPVNALRALLREGINRVRPSGERRFTAEWMLYNILEMKFLEGRKVRDVAMRLAMSEADLYRKQRVAIEAVTQAIADMERNAAMENMEEES